MIKIAMTAFAATFAAVLLSGSAAGTVFAGTLAHNAVASSASHTNPHNVCLQTNRIDHTTYKNKDNSILFHMRNGKIWKNHLRTPCNGLSFYGFAYVNYTNEICGNFQSIRVLQTDQVCMLGPFTQYGKPKS